MMFLIKKTESFLSFLDLFERWCLKKNYLIENTKDSTKDIRKNIILLIKNPEKCKIDVISRYLLAHYFNEFVSSINENGLLVKKYVKKNKKVPDYIFDFNKFYLELNILFK